MAFIGLRCSDELKGKVEAEADRRKKDLSSIVVEALTAYFNRGQQNFETLLYEIIKTRAVMMRVYDPEGTVITQQLCEEAGKDAMAYLEGQKNSIKAA